MILPGATQGEIERLQGERERLAGRVAGGRNGWVCLQAVDLQKSAKPLQGECRRFDPVSTHHLTA